MTEDPIHYKWRPTWGTTRCSGCTSFCGFLYRARPGVLGVAYFCCSCEKYDQEWLVEILWSVGTIVSVRNGF